MNTRVAHLTSVHQPHDTRILHKQCRSLAEAGYDVSLIAPHTTNEQLHGVSIRAVAKPRGRANRLLQTRRAVLQAAIELDAAIYHFHDPELIPVGLKLGRLGKRVVYDVHEDYPKQVLSKHWIPRPMRGVTSRMLGRLEARAARRFAGVVAATPTIAKRFPCERTITVNNYPVLDGNLEPSPAITSNPSQFKVAYIGGITEPRGVFDLLDMLVETGDPAGVRLELAGKFSPASLEQQARDHAGWPMVDFHGWQGRAEILKLLAGAQVGVVPLHALPRFVDSQPVKLFEYMAAGLPVIASDFPLWRTIIDSCKCGLLVQPNDPHALVSAVRWLQDHPAESREMGARGRLAVETQYNWRHEADKLVAFYERILHEDCHHRRRAATVRQNGDRQSTDRRVA